MDSWDPLLYLTQRHLGLQVRFELSSQCLLGFLVLEVGRRLV